MNTFTTLATLSTLDRLRLVRYFCDVWHRDHPDRVDRLSDLDHPGILERAYLHSGFSGRADSIGQSLFDREGLRRRQMAS